MNEKYSEPELNIQLKVPDAWPLGLTTVGEIESIASNVVLFRVAGNVTPLEVTDILFAFTVSVLASVTVKLPLLNNELPVSVKLICEVFGVIVGALLIT